MKESFSVEDILIGNVCGNSSKNHKIKLEIRKIADRNDNDILKNMGQNNTNGNSLGDNQDRDVNFWFKIAMVSLSIVLIIIIGISTYCLKRLLHPTL